MQTAAHERIAYFDSALMLLMFLLAGRFLDQRMRRLTRDFAINLYGDPRRARDQALRRR